ncbi:MAG TPA: hypothetical protein VHT00_14055 [Stellaceae bacterium]|jgi:hypothetical protein|nr:hypothetical protein [Stellaceae bacterium]
MTVQGLIVHCDFCDGTVTLAPANCWDDWMEELHHDRRWRSQWKDGKFRHACVECREALPPTKWERR